MEGGAKHSSEADYGRSGTAGRGRRQPPTSATGTVPTARRCCFLQENRWHWAASSSVATSEMVLEDSA